MGSSVSLFGRGPGLQSDGGVFSRAKVIKTLMDNSYGSLGPHTRSTPIQGKASFFRPKPKQSSTTSETWDFDVPTQCFSALKAAGLSNRLEVEAIVHATGRRALRPEALN